jgi:uncharacterized membrane protein YozB (DUF420 family)
MERNIQKLMRNLYVELFAVWGIIILTWILGETGVIPNGELVAKGQQFEFYVDVALILLTIVCVPLALKLFALNTQRGLRRMDKDEALSAYHTWSIVRLALLLLCAVLGVLVYFLLMDDKGVYCAGIAVVTTLFCIPSEKKVKEFLASKEEEDSINI